MIVPPLTGEGPLSAQGPSSTDLQLSIGPPDQPHQ